MLPARVSGDPNPNPHGDLNHNQEEEQMGVFPNAIARVTWQGMYSNRG